MILTFKSPKAVRRCYVINHPADREPASRKETHGAERQVEWFCNGTVKLVTWTYQV